ncbi:MAG: phage portal protein, partial [Nitrososphaerota archaeon]
MSFIRRLFENFRVKEQKGIVVAPSIWKYTGEPRSVSLEEFEHFYKSDAEVRSAIDTLAEMVAGVGYYTTAESSRAKNLVDEFAEKVNLDALLVDVVRNMLLFGDAYVERIFNKKQLVDLLLLPSKTVKVVRDEHGKIEKYIQSTVGHRVEFKPEEIIQFSYLKIGNSAYGVSLLEPILPALRQKEKSIEAMGRILERYASPRVIWKVPTPRDAQILANALSSLEPGQDPIISGEVEFQPLTIDPRVNFQFFYEYLDKQIFEALKAPSLSWFRNATEASAKVMLDIVERHIAGIQRYVKRKVEAEIFKPLVEAHGLREVPRLNWGIPATKLDEIGI